MSVGAKPAVEKGLAERLRRATMPAMVEAAPGEFVPADDKVPVEEYGLGKWKQDPSGRFRFVPFREPFVRLDSRVAKILGFNYQRHTIYRLGRAGFVELIKVAPACYLINLDSWYNHLRRCAENPEGFWEKKGKNWREYAKTI